MIGSEGQVARSLRSTASQFEQVKLFHTGRSQFDLRMPHSIEAWIKEYRPDALINPAAYTSVENAERDSKEAFVINRDGVGVVAAVAARFDIPIIHLSTDYVFDGRKKTPYLESDTPNPLNVYGQSKLAGEFAVKAANPKHVILRTGWVYSDSGSNFVRTVLGLMENGTPLRIIDDQRGCPTCATDIAEAIITIALRVQDWKPTYGGVTHLVGPDSVTWYDFAKKIVALAVAKGWLAVPVNAISTSEYLTAAVRPANSCLATDRLASTFGICLPPLEASLSTCVDRLLQGDRRAN